MQPAMPESLVVQMAVGAAGVKAVVDDKSRRAAARAGAASSICRLFFSRVRQEITYTAKKVCSVTFVPEICLALQIPPAEASPPSSGGAKARGAAAQKQGQPAPVDLTQCLAAFFSSEEIDGGTKKRLSLDTAPPALLLQLKRFNFDARRGESIKILRDVTYPLRLALSADICSQDLWEEGEGAGARAGSASNSLPPSSSSTSSSSSSSSSSDLSSPPQPSPGLRYSLAAVVLHHGQSTAGGHYTTCALGADGVWRHFDDAGVDEVTEASALAQTRQCYLLYYVRC